MSDLNQASGADHQATSSTTGRWSYQLAAACLIAAALLIRVVHVQLTAEVPLIRHLIGDAAGYYAWAAKIAGGQWLGDTAYYQAPLYPYVLAICLRIAGTSVEAIRWMQCLFGAAAVGCLVYGTTRMFDRRTGWVAGAMLAAYGPAIFFDGIVQKASLGCLLVCGLIAIMARSASHRGVWSWTAVGAAAGLVVLTRENAMVWLLVLPVWAWTAGKGDGGRWRQVAGLGLGIIIVLGPIGVRNRVVGGQWSLSTFQAGPNFYIGNHQGADGRYQPLVRGHESPIFERKDARELAEGELGRSLSPGEVSRFWMERALGEIKADPAGWVGLMGRKMLMVWNRYEVSDGESPYVYEEYSAILRVLGFAWHFGVLCPLAAVGVWATRGMWRRLWVYYALIASMAMAVALFYVMARYRFPLVPLLIPFAAAGSVDLWQQIRSHNFIVLAGKIGVAVVVAVLVNWPIHDQGRLDAMAAMNLGVSLAEEGDIDGATRFFRKAVIGHPQSAEANNNLAQALAVQGHYADAIPHYEVAQRSGANLPGVDYNLAVALERMGRSEAALEHFERAVERDPQDSEAQRAVTRLRQRGP